MIDFCTLILILCFLGLCYLLLSNKKQNPNLPPGPKGIPIFGFAPFLRPPIFQAFTNLGHKYGDIVAVKIGSLQFILLNSYDAFRKTMLDDADNFSGRLQSDYINRVSRSCGLIFVDGPRWVEHRRFSLKVLRDFGLGKSLSETIIQNESEALVIQLKQSNGVPVNTTELFSRNVSNVISTIAFGDRPGSDDAEFSTVMKKMHHIAHSSTFLNMLPIIFPALSFIIPISNKLFGKQTVVVYTEDGHEFIKKKIENIRTHLSTDQEPTNLTEAYLLEQNIKIQRNNKDEIDSYSDFQLMRLIFELFIAGTDTTSMALTWACLLLALHPEIQSKLHAEVDETIGRKRLPQLQDRKSMPYLQAIIDEVSRFSSLAPTSIPHRNFNAVQINGYTIPPNSVVIPNIYAVHHDPRVWENPQKFYPEHFLNEKGQYRSRQELVFFGVGKRSCLGESLARSEFFIFLASLLQSFNFKLNFGLHHHCTLKQLTPVESEELLSGSEGTVRAPGKHDIIFEKR